MFDSVRSIFFETLTAVGQIFFIALVAAFLIKKKLFKQENIKALSELTVDILLPAMVFSNMIKNFNPWQNPNWWILPIIGLTTPLIGLLVAFLLFGFKLKGKSHFYALASYQNAGYLVLPLGQLLFKDKFEIFANYTFLYLIGLNLSLWTIGKILITSTIETKIELKSFITPPFIANVSAIVLVYCGLNKFFLPPIMEPIRMLGSATVPIANFILGATIATIEVKQIPNFLTLFRIIFVKYIFLPFMTSFIILQLSLHNQNALLSDFLILEATAPPAANLILMVKRWGGNHQQTGAVMLITYLISILFLPLNMAFWYFFKNL